MILPIALQAMLIAVALLLLPTLVASSGEGNIHLLNDEVATALRSCSYNESIVSSTSKRDREIRSNIYYRQRRQVTQINNTNNENMEKRDFPQLDVLNVTEDNIPSYDRANTSVKYVRTAALPSMNAYKYTTNNFTRRKRNLIEKLDQDQCLSQCVFANLQVVDEKGIPREAELWNKVQKALTSQQSRTLLKDQIRACFQELQSEDENDGCSYSNKLERCLMLRFSDRKMSNETKNI